MIRRKELEKREDEFLASYASKSHKSLGRVYKEPEHEYRSIYQRDKERIIHSTAFRRLEYKTQVFVNHEGDYYRTRLTHTLEVAQIAKAIGRSLALNEDLIEAIALAHDLGHTPFGHSGEEALQEIMKEHGGFDHNSQGLRVVDLLEERYSGFKGLNLTWEVREGIVKHATSFDKPRPYIPFESKSPPTLEAQVVDIADEIAYDNHDLDDGITSGLIKERDLMQIDIWKGASEWVKKHYISANEQVKKYQIIRRLINAQVTDLVYETERNIKRYKIETVEDIKKLPHKIVSFSEKLDDQRKPLREFLVKNLYHHYRVVRMSDKAKRFIKALFDVYLERPEQLPPSTQVRLEEDLYRGICDYIAGMTDRFALDEYKRLFEPYERV